MVALMAVSEMQQENTGLEKLKLCTNWLFKEKVGPREWLRGQESMQASPDGFMTFYGAEAAQS